MPKIRIIVLICIVGTWVLIGACQEAINPTLIEAAEEINAQCPISVDRETTLDNVAALPDNVFEYNYSLININADSIDIEPLRSHLSNVIVNNVKVSDEMEKFRELETTILFAYIDKNGRFLFEIEVTPELYFEF